MESELLHVRSSGETYISFGSRIKFTTAMLYICQSRIPVSMENIERTMTLEGTRR